MIDFNIEYYKKTQKSNIKSLLATECNVINKNTKIIQNDINDQRSRIMQRIEERKNRNISLTPFCKNILE